MAPPSHRRPGFSRKAQYSLFAAYLTAMAGILGGLCLLVIAIFDPAGFATLRVVGAEVVAPVARVTNTIRLTVRDGTANISGYFDAAAKNAAMERKLRDQKTALIQAEAIAAENAQLRRLLGLVQTGVVEIARGQIISTTASSARRLATLSVGQNRGVSRGQPVMAPEGLVGRILESGPTTAQVLLITDTDSVVPVQRAADGLPAFATGRGDGRLMIRPIQAGANPFAKGDIIVTSGNGGLYPPNTPVAIVVGGNADGAFAQPLADPARAAFVSVQPVYMPEAVATDVQVSQEAAASAAANGND